MRAVARVAVAGVLACSLPAAAQSGSGQAAATIQFDKGRALLKQGKFKEACEAFEASQKLDPANGTLFNIAECSEKIGKLTTAWLAYRELAQNDTNAGRKTESGRRAKALQPRLPKLLIKIEAPPPGLVVKLGTSDATALVGLETPVDFGDHVISATAPGYQPFEVTQSVTAERKTIEVTIELEEDTPVGGTPKPPKKKTPKVSEPIATPESPGSTRKRTGILFAIGGGVALVGGTMFGLRARSKWSDAEALCPENTCSSGPDKAQGDELVADARSAATKSTVLMIGGAALTAIGIYFVVTAPSRATTTAIRFAPLPDGGAVVLGGRF